MLDVGLYCLRALRGLWGFCVREWLGGLEACGVFAFIYPFVCLSFYAFALLLSFCVCSPLLVLLSCLSCFVFVGAAFSLTDEQTKRKGAKVLLLASSLRVL